MAAKHEKTKQKIWVKPQLMASARFFVLRLEKEPVSMENWVDYREVANHWRSEFQKQQAVLVRKDKAVMMLTKKIGLAFFYGFLLGLVIAAIVLKV